VGISPSSLHGKAVVTRSALWLVTEVNADDERADAGYAKSLGWAPRAAMPTGAGQDERSRNDNVKAPSDMVSPAGLGPRERLQRGCTRRHREASWPVAT
jgi:hypothetical protein